MELSLCFLMPEAGNFLPVLIQVILYFFVFGVLLFLLPSPFGLAVTVELCPTRVGRAL